MSGRCLLCFSGAGPSFASTLSHSSLLVDATIKSLAAASGSFAFEPYNGNSYVDLVYVASVSSALQFST